MTRRTALARAYFAPAGYLDLTWTEEDSALSTERGRTIVLREELLGILKRLVPSGLPPFDAMALALAACRSSWREMREEIFAGVDAPGLAEKLDEVHALREELRTGPGPKALLIEALFEGSPRRLSSAESREIVVAFEEGGLELFELPGPGAIRAQTVELAQRELAGARVDEESLSMQSRTGLREIPLPAGGVNLEVADSKRARRLIEKLRKEADRELRRVGDLAMDLLAAAHLPRPVSAPEDLPAGGVTDIANRGPLERLLLSELAHDDFTLAVRVALNEALYLRRESPPRTPPSTRAILVDAGIRMWGLPRVFAAAAALALAATTDRKDRVQAFRTRGRSIERVDLTTREGMIELLAAQEAEVHPAEAMKEFFAVVGPDSDSVVVTHPQAMQEREVEEAFAAGEGRVFAATVTRKGEYRLYQAGRRARVELKRAEIPLGEILPGERSIERVEEEERDLPEILRMDQLPIRMPFEADPRRGVLHPVLGAVAVSGDGRLLRWDRPNRGAQELSSRFPPGRLHWIEMDDWEDVSAVISRRTVNPVLLVRYRVLSSQLHIQPLAGTNLPVLGVWSSHGVIHVAGTNGVNAYSSATGEPVGSVRLEEGLVRGFGRYLRTARSGWRAVHYDGTGVRVATIEPPAGKRAAGWTPQAIFDREGEEGPWEISESGWVRPIDQRVRGKRLLWWARHVEAISRDGHRLICSGSVEGRPSSQGRWLVDLKKNFVRRQEGHAWSGLEPQFEELTRSSIGIPRRFTAVAFDGQGRLALRMKSGVCLHFDYEPADRRIVVKPREPGKEPLVFVEFGPPFRLPGREFSLRRARWIDGSSIYLDGRGLVHLKSCDRSIPEVSVVPVAGPAAGWASTGERCGSDYFLGSEISREADRIAEYIRKFAWRLR
jgi:hypothetical protein